MRIVSRAVLRKRREKDRNHAQRADASSQAARWLCNFMGLCRHWLSCLDIRAILGNFRRLKLAIEDVEPVSFLCGNDGDTVQIRFSVWL